MQAQTPEVSSEKANTAKNFTVHEWEGLLRGRAMPGDIYVNEPMAAYLHRKFQALIDALEIGRAHV